MTKGKLFSALALAGCLLAAPINAQAEKAAGWVGIDFAPDSYYAYVGAVAAISGQDLASQDGWVLRATAGFGQYDYDTTAVPGGNVEGDGSAGDLMIGYAYFFNGGNAKALVGGDVNHNNLDPNDPTSRTDGTEGGVKGMLELNVNAAQNVDLGAMGSYSTSFDTYWSRFTGTYNFGPVKFGPEVLFMGNDSYDQTRIGAALSDIDLNGFATGRVYAGYASTRGQGDDGMYGGLSLGKSF